MRSEEDPPSSPAAVRARAGCLCPRRFRFVAVVDTEGGAASAPSRALPLPLEAAVISELLPLTSAAALPPAAEADPVDTAQESLPAGEESVPAKRRGGAAWGLAAEGAAGIEGFGADLEAAVGTAAFSTTAVAITGIAAFSVVPSLWCGEVHTRRMRAGRVGDRSRRTANYATLFKRAILHALMGV